MRTFHLRAAEFARRLLTRDDRGATAVEYGLIVALIAAVIIAVVATLGTAVSSAFNNVVSQL
jgi:pilus assembly protein Flp/PilA